ncbi:hypothetical protein Pmani_018288 [Petrolisthes manimaculis]|uniref:Uncharacterized protein n=1 Tax=Petrolisthes manimaculis TaxID=1843537 RepID=A0AAE1U4Z2_9EUCA|nr:hypothetical protein Pmani_018288 [Petrolisthes manimaculis]
MYKLEGSANPPPPAPPGHHARGSGRGRTYQGGKYGSHTGRSLAGTGGGVVRGLPHKHKDTHPPPRSRPLLHNALVCRSQGCPTGPALTAAAGRKDAGGSETPSKVKSYIILHTLLRREAGGVPPAAAVSRALGEEGGKKVKDHVSIPEQYRICHVGGGRDRMRS